MGRRGGGEEGAMPVRTAHALQELSNATLQEVVHGVGPLVDHEACCQDDHNAQIDGAGLGLGPQGGHQLLRIQQSQMAQALCNHVAALLVRFAVRQQQLHDLQAHALL